MLRKNTNTVWVMRCWKHCSTDLSDWLNCASLRYSARRHLRILCLGEPEVYWRAVGSAWCKSNEVTHSVVHKHVMPLHLIAFAQKPPHEQLKEAGGWKSNYMMRKDDNMTLDVAQAESCAKYSSLKAGLDVWVWLVFIRLQRSDLTYQPVKAKQLEHLFFNLILSFLSNSEFEDIHKLVFSCLWVALGFAAWAPTECQL